MSDQPEKAPEWDRTGKCTRCGKCCTRIATYMQYQKELQDYFEWISLHQNATVAHDKGTGIVWIEFATKCRHLRFKQGKALCRIYDRRPKICQDFPSSPIVGKNCPGFTFTLRDPAKAP